MSSKQKRKRRPSQQMQEIQEFVSSMSATGLEVPRHGLNPTLRIPRDALVKKTIKLAEESLHHVYIRGAPGTGKTVLLELIAVQLEKEGKRAVFIQHASSLQECMDEIEDILKDGKPLYVLIDEAHMVPANDPVWMYLKKPSSPFITIAAGIPGDSRASAMFFSHIQVKEMFLTATELELPVVVNFFTKRLSESLVSKRLRDNQAECRAMVEKVLAFAHMYTNGHSFPCLKIAEFCVTAGCMKCWEIQMENGDMDDMKIALTKLLSTSAFDEVYDMIYQRCYHVISGSTFERLISAWWSDSIKCEAVLDDLTRIGLWLREENCLISLLLQQVVLKKRGDAGRQKFVNVNYAGFGHVLAYVLSFLRNVHFSQLMDTEEMVRERCEDGIGLFIGARLSGIEGIYLSPQHAIPNPEQRRGRPPSVDYYLDNSLDMYLELTRNGSLLEQHFQRFQLGGKYFGKPFVLLDIEMRKGAPPMPLPAAVSEFEHCRYTFVLSLNTLYRGTDVFKAGIILPTIRT